MSADTDREVEDRINARIEGEQRQRREKFDRLFAEWLTNRADYQNPDIEWTAERGGAFRSRGRAGPPDHHIPGCFPWKIFAKLEVLEYYLGTNGGTG
jgi:hypothetical protein